MMQHLSVISASLSEWLDPFIGDCDFYVDGIKQIVGDGQNDLTRL